MLLGAIVSRSLVSATTRYCPATAACVACVYWRMPVFFNVPSFPSAATGTDIMLGSDGPRPHTACVSQSQVPEESCVNPIISVCGKPPLDAGQSPESTLLMLEFSGCNLP